MLRTISAAVLATVPMLLAGCTTFGTNISGSFRCEAPDGVCAPSTVIDDNALSEITQADASEVLSPAGPYKVDDGDGGRARLANAQGVIATQNQAYKLNVVFPAYTDVAGVTHQRRSVTTEVALPGRTASTVELASRSRGQKQARGLLAAAQSAPVLVAANMANGEELAGASTSPDGPKIVLSGEGTKLADGTAAKAPPAVGHGAAAPATAVDRIKAEVDAKLSSQARRQAASFPSPE